MSHAKKHSKDFVFMVMAKARKQHYILSQCCVLLQGSTNSFSFYDDSLYRGRILRAETKVLEA